MSALRFPYQIRVNARAKRMSIKLSAQKGVEVVVPKRHKPSALAQFLSQHQAWVLEHRNVWEVVYQPIELPTEIVLPALGQWTLAYQPDAQAPKCLREQPGELSLMGALTSSETVELLRRWLKKQARVYFTERMAQLSLQTGLNYQRLSVRMQSTRWGSCSAKQSISLNAKLLFFPAEVIDYVMIHELAHTQHMDHSKAFWSLLAKLCPDYEQHTQRLRNAMQVLPTWVLLSD